MKTAIAIALMLPFTVAVIIGSICLNCWKELLFIISFLLFILGLTSLLGGCSPTSAQQPTPVASFGHVLQTVKEIESPKPKEVGEVKPQPSLAAMQLTINLANYYATRCLEDGTVNEECLNEAMKCAGQLKQQDNMTDALLKCAKSINP